MANLYIHSIVQQAYTYQIHSIVFTCWISLQIFAFLPSHFLMEALSLKTSKTGLIILWHKSAHFPTYRVSGNKNTIHCTSITAASKAEKWSCGRIKIKVSLLHKKGTRDIWHSWQSSFSGYSRYFNIFNQYLYLPPSQYETSEHCNP